MSERPLPQILFVNDVVTVEDAPGFMPADAHGYFLSTPAPPRGLPPPPTFKFNVDRDKIEKQLAELSENVSKALEASERAIQKDKKE
jgi:hypothetical protein